MGRLIVIEGIDGSGKATQTGLLEQRLKEAGEQPLRLSFPDYESDSSALVKLYLSGALGKSGEVNAFAASSFYSVDRYASFKKNWQSHYESGRLILCDRYTTSNITHQAGKEPPEKRAAYIEWLCDFEYGKLRLPKPNLVIYLDMHPAVSQKLMDKRYSGDNTKKDIHESDISYLYSCRENALLAAEQLGWQVISCFDEKAMEPRGQNEISGEVWEKVAGYLKK